MDYTILDALKQVPTRWSRGTKTGGQSKKLLNALSIIETREVTDPVEVFQIVGGEDGLTPTDVTQIVLPSLHIANASPYFLSIDPADLLDKLSRREGTPSTRQRDIPRMVILKEMMNWGGAVGCAGCFSVALLKPSEFHKVTGYVNGTIQTTDRSIVLPDYAKKLFDEKNIFDEQGPWAALRNSHGSEKDGTLSTQNIYRHEWRGAQKNGMPYALGQIRLCVAVSELVQRGWSSASDDVAERMGITTDTLDRNLNSWVNHPEQLISQNTYDAIYG